jgi:hypothetical protein
MANSRETMKTTVSVTIEDYDWLKKHPQYSLSGLLAWAIRYHKAMEKKLDISGPF